MNSKNNTNLILNKIVSSDKCLEKILNASNNQEIKDIFKTEGLDLSNEQIESIKSNFRNKIMCLDKNLDEDFLENVSGGKNIDVENAMYKGIGYGGNCGLLAGLGIGAISGAVDTIIKIKNKQLDTSWDAIKGILKTSILTGIVASTASALTGATVEIAKETFKNN